MTLDEQVAEFIDRDVILRVGSDSGYVWIGKPKDYDKEIDALSDEWYHYFSDVLEDAENGLFNFMHTPIKPPKMGTSAMPTPEEYLVTLQSKVESLRQSIDAVQARGDRLDAFTPFRDRPVLKCYKLMQPKHVAIIVAGNEGGLFWDDEEWKGQTALVPHCEVRRKLTRKEWGKYEGE